MPISFELEPEAGVIRTTATGRLTAAELLNLKKRIHEHPGFRRDLLEISDARGVTDLDFGSAGVHALVQTDEHLAEEYGDGYRLAIVVSEQLAFELGRGYEFASRKKGANVRVFRDVALAREWLGIAPVDQKADGSE